MFTRALAAAIAVAFLAAASATPSLAEDKKLTPQQQKMKDCAAKWKDEKATKKVSGRAAYNNFMKGCLSSKS